MHSPGLVTADVAPAVRLSPLACATPVLSVPDMAVCWEMLGLTFSFENTTQFSKQDYKINE